MTPTRRSVLTSAALASAASLVVPRAVHAADSSVLKVGIIGCGGRGSGAAVQALTADKNNHLVAMADMFPDKLQGALGRFKANKAVADQVKVTPETCFVGVDAYKKLIDSDVDVVLLTTPPGFRPIHFKYAVERNKHIFAEKPLCVDAAGYRSIQASVEEAKKKNLAFVDGFCWRYSIGERATFPRLHDGAIGDITSIYSYYNAAGLWMNPRQPDWSDTEWQLRNWLYFTWLSGDHIVEQAVHTIDKVSWAMKDVPPVKAWGTGGRQVRTDPAYGHIWDHFAIVYEWANGARAHVYCRQQNQVMSGVEDHYTGTKGNCDIVSSFSPKNGGPNYVIRQFGEQGPGWRLADVPKDFPNAYQVEHNELFASIRAGKPLNSGARVANSAMLAIMGRMAAYTGQVVTWDQAVNSKEALYPDTLDLKAPMPTPEIALPGKTKLI